MGPGVGEFGEHRLLDRRRRDGDGSRFLAVGPHRPDFGGDFLVALVATHVEVLDVALADVGGVGDGGGVEQADELGEAVGVAVVRGGAREEEGLGAGGEDAGELVVEGAAVDEVVALVDDDGVPADAFEMVAVAAGVLRGCRSR